MINNLILNARDALVETSVAHRTDRQIQITSNRVGNTATITVRDNGVGIPAENLQKIFEPFFSTKPASGSGLGLGMVRNIVLIYNGKVDVRSEPGETVITVSVPVNWMKEDLQVAA